MLNALIIDLDHVDHTIRLFDPDCDVTLAQPKQFPARHAVFRGEMQRFVLGALRAATAPLTSLKIAIEVVKGRGLDPNDPRAVSLIHKRVGACLFHLKAKGIAQDVPTAGPYKGWEPVGLKAGVPSSAAPSICFHAFHQRRRA